MPDRERILEATLIVLLVIGVAVSFTDWAHSGKAGRSSYELVRSADRLGLLDGGPASVGSVVWFLVPMLAASAIVAVVVGRARVGAAIATAVGLLLVTGWWVVRSSPLRVDAGARAGGLFGLAVIVAAVAMVAATRSHRGR